MLLRAHFDEEDCRAGVLLEQAAQALLHVRPPALRKYAFNMVLAGTALIVFASTV